MSNANRMVVPLGLTTPMKQTTSRVDTAVATIREHSIGDASTVLRVGLGIVILLAGLHKLVAPAVWGDYLAPIFAMHWPVSITLTMVVFGLSELPFGVLLIIDRYTLAAAVVVAVSMAGTVIDLVIAALQTGQFVDILIRDFGLLVLAIGVVLVENANHSSNE